MAPRYAIYWAPDRDSALSAFGQRWLGRDAWTGDELSPPDVPGLTTDRIRDITAEPARYGLHATLKPPFVLAPGETAPGLESALADFAMGRPPVTLPGLRLVSLGGFLALVPTLAPPELRALADGCVQAFDRFRAPPDGAEMARRRRAGLTPRQDELLARWGYPYVLEEFRFHVTLTDRLADPERTTVDAALRPLVAPFADAPITIGALALFRQIVPDAPFTIVRNFALG